MPPSNGHTAILTVEDHFSMMAHFSSHLYSGGSSAHLTGPQSAYHWVSPPVQWPVRTQEPGGGDGSTMFGLQTSVVLVPAAPVDGIHLQHLDQLCQRTFPSSSCRFQLPQFTALEKEVSCLSVQAFVCHCHWTWNQKLLSSTQPVAIPRLPRTDKPRRPPT